MTNSEILKRIDRYINGELSRSETDELWVLFLQNPEYYKWFETELHLRKLAADRNAKESNQNAGSADSFNDRKKFRPWYFAAAALLAASFALSLFLLQDRSSLYSLAIEKIDYSELSGSDIYRSDEAATADIDVLINQGLAYAYNSEESRALDHFLQLLDQNPDSLQTARIQMNLGILNYNLRSFDEAALMFRQAANSEEVSLFFSEKAWWFLGNAYLNLRDFENAMQAIKRVTELDGRYQREAEELLRAIDEM